MTREELKRHCLKQIEDCEMWARYKGEEPHGKIYEEHKLILELLEQEPKPMVEIDLYSVIKQKYIEREVLDKIRAEIETKYGQCDICEYDAISGWEQVSDIADILQIIDKYKAESEQTDGNVD